MAQLGYAIVAAVAAALLYSYVDAVLQTTGRTLAHRRALRRARHAELAAIEAGDETPAFAPESVRREIELMLGLVDRSWATGEDTLADRCDRDALARWAGHIEVLCEAPRLGGLQEARVVHVVNREGELEDRVDVWVRVRLTPRARPALMRLLGTRTLDQHWTLGRRADAWELLAFVDAPPGGRALRRRLVPMPWTDRERLHGESLRELAAAEAAPVATSPQAERRDAHLRVLDLSLADARFSEPVIEAVLLRLLDALEQARLGRPQLLRRLAAPEAIEHLARQRWLRDQELERWQVMTLDEHAPVRVGVALAVRPQGDLKWVLEEAPGADPLWRLAASLD